MSKMKLGPLQKKWVKLLESGNYMQGKGKLCDVNYSSHYPDGICKFCCLGIAADQVLEVKPQEDIGHLNLNAPHEPMKITQYSYDFDTAWLSDKSRTKLGLTPTGQKKLAKMNDGGKMFKTIAKEIKDNPEKYFFKSA